MAKILKIATVSANEEGRKESRKILQRLIDNPDLEAVFVVYKKADGRWAWDFAGNEFVVEMLGRVDIAKHEYVHKYLKSEEERDD